MASVNPHTRELVFKLVFYGPGLGGKTTTLQYIHAATKPEHRGKMVSLATPTDRTLYFDFLPIRVPRVRGMAVRLQLFTVPGQVYYAATRKLVLSGADAVVFVADSQAGRLEMNQESLDDLHANLGEHQRSLEEVPHTFHWNKRDLGELVPIEELDRRFNKYGVPSLGTVATKGEGVFEGLERITRLVLKSYENDPKVKIDPAVASPGHDAASGPRIADEDGVAQALREMEASGGDAPTKVSGAVVPVVPTGPSRGAASVDAAPVAAEGAAGSVPAESRTRSPRAPEVQDVRGSGSFTRFTFPEPPGPANATGGAPLAGGGVASAADGAAAAADKASAFSLSELWPESDRESVRQAEAMIGLRDAVNAILACDVLVTRVLASAAGLVGTLDAPRDPAVVAMLLGLDGSRYLYFRMTVRAARHREHVTMKDALEAFAFALEARRARELLRR
jgi:signal recognition particle receptor subunit beta